MTDVRIEDNVVVGKAGERELLADVVRPAHLNGPAPGILVLPGGGWRNCDRAPLKERYSLALAGHGYVCVNGEYRVMDEAPWPAQIHDVKAIIRWMRANSGSLGIDPSLILVAGKSAGGHLALIAAGSPDVAEFEGNGGSPGVSSRVAAVVGMSPVADITDRVGKPENAPLFGESPSAQLVEAANPVSYARENYPPTLLFHGTSDTRVHHSSTLLMYERLEKAGVPVDLHLYAGEDHFFDREPHFARAVTDAIALFINRYVMAHDPVAAD